MSIFPRYSGIPDILPEDHEYFTHIKKVVRYHARRTGMKRVTLPAIENREAMEAILGKSAPVLRDQTFFLAKGDQEWILRSDYAVSLARAYVEHVLSEKPKPVQFYYIDHIWRDVPSRPFYFSQFLSFGFEVMGEQDPALDAQMIEMCHNIYDDLCLPNIKLRIHTAGTRVSQEKYADELHNFYAGKERVLCANCLENLPENPLRLVGCQEEDCKILAEIAPKFGQFLDAPSKEHYAKVKEYLEILSIPFTEDLTYLGNNNSCTHTVFEFYFEIDGEKISLGAGGRHDTMIETMGGEPTPALGFTSGFERITELMKKVLLRVPSKDRVDVFVVQIGDDAKKAAMKLVSDLRRNGVKTMGALGKAAIRAQLTTASEFDVQYALVLGQMEVMEKKIIIRDMKKGTQEILPMAGIVEYLVELLGAHRLDTQNFKAMVEEVTETD